MKEEHRIINKELRREGSWHQEVKVVLGIARGLVRLSKENLAVLMKMQRWQTSHRGRLGLHESRMREGTWTNDLSTARPHMTLD